MTRVVRWALILAVLGLVGYDGGVLVIGRLDAQDDANNAAAQAAYTWQNQHNAALAQTAAVGELHHGEHLVPGSFVIASDGSVSLRVSRKVSTLVAQDLPSGTRLTDFDMAGSAPAPQD